MAAKESKEVKEVKEPRYSKRQLIKDGRYSADVLEALLEDGAEYTEKEVEKKVTEFWKREVK